MASPAAAGNGPRNQTNFTNTLPSPQSDIWWIALSASEPGGLRCDIDRPSRMSSRSIRATSRQGSSRNSAKRRQTLTLDRKNNLAPPRDWVNKGAQGTRGGGQVKQISIFVLGLATAFASASAPAQDLTAGKTPAQLFRPDCAECHRSPSGLAKTRDVRALADFLREHYTTKSETAGALAAYVSSLAAGGAAARNRGNGAAAPATGGYPPRNRGEAHA